ncbi:HK97 family phage prohead protease [Brevundimonas sp. S30B]|uniref:HK97 family phage prohead protease n=1 Tax=unclassified Brevundimonas TaxID=2622653 RepID=UPI001071FD79|nr:MULTISPECIES: HK97 family phage prohead protease [unclassified Brevundimonas]QBX38662.1 HK97 family phage prohead protease [Brevundimonas sp. MF30-B]TFW01253.1 HK97 family phage prohead protease [Brevundimonas sp. S30B]
MLQTKDSGLALDVKAVGDDGVIEGYASAFGVVDSYNEVVEPGAFTASLVDGRRKGRSVKMLWQHDTTKPIGVWDDLAEDSKGLYVKGRILKDVSPLAAEAYGLIKAGALDELSIGYRTVQTEPHDDKQGVLRLLKLDLKEVSIVTFGALSRAARITDVKSILEGGSQPTVRQFEEHLRDAGFSKSAAAAMASACKPYLRGEPEAKADDVLAFLSALRG